MIMVTTPTLRGLGTEPSDLLLLGHRQRWCGVGIGGGLTPAAHLLREQTPLPSVGIEFGVVEASGLVHHRDLVGSLDQASREHLASLSLPRREQLADNLLDFSGPGDLKGWLIVNMGD